MPKAGKSPKKSKSPKKGGVRKVKKVKDPNAPKRATTAFFFFSHDQRSSVVKVHPGWKVSEVASELGRQWKSLPDAKKKTYEAKAVADKARYEREMKAYRK